MHVHQTYKILLNKKATFKKSKGLFVRPFKKHLYKHLDGERVMFFMIFFHHLNDVCPLK